MTKLSRALVVQETPSPYHDMKSRRDQREAIEKQLTGLVPIINERVHALRLRQHWVTLRFSEHLGGPLLDVARTKSILRNWFWETYRGNPKFVEYKRDEGGEWIIHLYR